MTDLCKNVSDIKKNIFNHILYEFEMYLDSYMLFSITSPSNIDKQLWNNVLIECHSIHLRILLEFFKKIDPECGTKDHSDKKRKNKGKSTITTRTIFNNPTSLDLDITSEMKQPLNKALGHLTTERHLQGSELSHNLIKVINKMFKEEIPSRIKKCVELLLHKTSVKAEFSDDLNHPEIQARLNNLIQRFERFEK